MQEEQVVDEEQRAKWRAWQSEWREKLLNQKKRCWQWGDMRFLMDIWEEDPYKEIWVELQETEDDERIMMALINGDWGWLMYLREEGDSGLSSRNPDYKGTDHDGKMMDFLLSNGQLDQYPLSYVLPVEQVMKALTYFEEYHELPKFITWHDDQFL